MTRRLETAAVCTDCYMAAEYGYRAAGGAYFVGDDTDPLEHEPLALLADDRGPWYCTADANTGDGICEFVRAACDGCGSPWAGARYRVGRVVMS